MALMPHVWIVLACAALLGVAIAEIGYRLGRRDAAPAPRNDVHGAVMRASLALAELDTTFHPTRD